jgi:carbamoyltransferase
VTAGDQILGVCEQERITRVRGAGVNVSGLPDESLDEILAQAGRERSDVSTVAVAEETTAGLPMNGATTLRFGHHFGHAAASFLASPFESATIIVCDDERPGVSVWTGEGTSMTDAEWAWHGPGLAEVYSDCAETFSFSGPGREQRLEALARFDPSGRDDRVRSLFMLGNRRLAFADSWQARLSDWIGGADSQPSLSVLAAAVQARIGEVLLEIIRDIRRRVARGSCLCLGGSLFENSHINAYVRASDIFEKVFVPINPGDAGLAVGMALQVNGPMRTYVTPFLGPSYSSEQVKATLDNCKLRYEWMSETDSIDVAIADLRKGRLVAWAEGAMEWGPRALGARSILANPLAPHVLENLNRFLKRRAPWRGYALSVLESAVADHFRGPAESPFMECDYTPCDPERLASILPGPRAAVRVQTVGEGAPPRFKALLERFGELTGLPILANTSFNGYREPVVCSPRDAVRVFYGTGIDLLLFDRFLIRK